MVSERLRKVRLLLGYGDKQKEFAEELDMRQGSYSDVERGKTKSVSKKMVRNLYQKFGVNEEYILIGKLPILTKEAAKQPNSIANDISLTEHINRLHTIVSVKNRQIDELILQQNELIQQQKKLIDTIISLIQQNNS